eukprot:CAMPEP_0115713640 /NCGR_PEP_ID=MMETSP0272-20121206/74780_1 /TAXON_ID=71861 /ORGANISM="Scrippsiella trochoidea, Strain CCMP3099" /LENGTH=61 /DNA_ID=CAMNT_0003155665 /DNA_START=132 /DNA_END=317 /DNA_ORIENTATION=+
MACPESGANLVVLLGKPMSLQISANCFWSSLTVLLKSLKLLIACNNTCLTPDFIFSASEDI